MKKFISYFAPITLLLAVALTPLSTIHAQDLSCTIVQDNPVSVIGGNDGQATVTASGGTAPYSYSWDGATTSLEFDGVDDGTGSYVDIGAFSLTSYTKEAWIKWDGTQLLQHNIISGSINGSQHAFWITGDELRSGHSGDFLAVTDTDKILPNIWYHCAVTYDGASGLMSLYKDGVLAAFTTVAPGFVLEGSYIGAFGNSSDEVVAVMSGQIDDVRVWDYARTQSEIQADMNSCLDGTETGLEALYNFEDGTGSTTLSDITGNGNTGILMNMDPATDWVMGKACGNTGPTATGLTAGVHTATITDAIGSVTTCDVTIEEPNNNICTEFDSNDFESGWGIWNDGGDDALLTSGFSAYTNSGSYVVRLRDDSGVSSSMYTNNLDMSAYGALEVSFSFMTANMDFEYDFFLEVSTDGGVSYTIVQEWNSGIDFFNDTRYNETVTISGIAFSENTVLRFRCDADLNNDMVFIDDVVINTCGASTGSDTDGDGIVDAEDNCPLEANADQADLDGDGLGDVCDTCPSDPLNDSDGDGVCDSVDICPGFDDLMDSDGDTVPDGCDICVGDDASGDTDGDGVCDSVDICPGFDDLMDSDGDTVPDGCDICTGDDASGDTDGDGVCDSIDNCIDIPNADQADSDGDGIGDVCECADSDGDGVCDSVDICPGFDDLIDTDGDTVPDGCDICTGDDASGDTDGDGVCDSIDNCIDAPNPDQVDVDNDGIGDICDPVIDQTCELFDSNDFELGWGIWNDGGDDALWTKSFSAYTNSGKYVIRLRDDSGVESSMFTNNLDMSAYGALEVSFSFMTTNMDFEYDFILEVSTDGGVSYTIVQSWISGIDFFNDTRYNETVNISGITFSDTTVIRIRCDALLNNDMVFIDDVVIKTCGASTGSDTDGDGIVDAEDNCPLEANADQADLDGDGLGDVCDTCPSDPLNDSDGDGVCDSVDICPGFDDLMDSDGDTVPDGCDICVGDDASGDTDGDGVCDSVDICPGFDDLMDSDGDTVPDGCDICTGDDASGDTDGDGVCDSIDNCIDIPNADQADSDGDGIGDVCECADSDGDGVCDSVDICPGFDDLIDTDGDTVPDGCDICTGDDASGDTDGDGVCDSIDNCIDAPNPDQVDVDNDGIGDICDPVIDQTCELFDSNDFELGWGIWNDGGDDALWTKSFSAYTNSGKYVIRLRDDSGVESSMFTNNLDMSAYGALEVSFSFMTTNMDFEYDFILEVSTDGGVSYTIVQSWISGIDFFNDTRYNETVNISGITFSDTTVIRIRCDALLNNDMVFIDDVVIKTCGASTGSDTDGDGIVDAEDNCPLEANADQADLDGDGLGDVCDTCPSDPLNDSDGDGVCDSVDICPGFDDLMDSDGDTVPDGCDICVGDDASGDTDGDGVCDSVDICPGFDDLMDSDGDTVPDGCDICTGDDASGDTDGDGVCDSIDNCIDIPNADQADSDGDGIGDVCECPDSDGDGVCDSVDICPGSDDLIDTDGDTVPDGCDSCTGDDASGDTDGDGVCDSIDNCIDTPNPDQVDVDNDGIGDICDPVIGDPCSESDLSCTIVQDNPVSVIGGNDGQATVTASGGTPPYMYSWGGATTSLEFDGVDDGTGSYVDIGAFSLTSYTKEAWIKWDGTEFLQHNIISGSINGSQHAFWITGDKLRSGHNGAGFSDVVDPGLIVANTWYHCAVTYDGGTGLMSLYKDGVLIAFNTVATGFVLEGSYLGAFGNSSDELVAIMSGQIDDARVWDYARTQSEIQADMNSCLDGTETGLEALYNFEDGTGSTTLSDLTGNGNNGILMNMNPATDWVMGKTCGNTGPTATGLTAGVHTVTITDDTGCTTTCDVTIEYVDTCSVFDSNDFETGWGIWNDGGDDALLTSGFSAYANSGSYVVRLRDDSGVSSSMYTDNLDMSAYSALEVSFSFMTINMEVEHDFFLEVSTDGGVSYTIVQSWILGIDFDNETRYDETVAISGSFSENTVLRFRCDADLNNDMVFIDDVVINTCGGSPLRKVSDQDESIHDLVKVMAWPNPSETSFNLELVSETELGKVNISVFDSSHKLIHSGRFDSKDRYAFGANFNSGVYTVKLVHSKGVETIRIIKE